MIHRPELLDALERLPIEQVDTPAWRHMFGSRPPDTENTRGARWNPAGVAAIYLCLSREGVIAEGDHAVAVQSRPVRAVRRVYPATVKLASVLDLSTGERLDEAGLTLDDLADDDFSACQEVGGAVAWLGHDGILVPSARSPAVNLVIYPYASDREIELSFDQPETLAT